MGGFPQSRNFYVSTHVNFTRVNKIEAMYRRSSRKHKCWTSLNLRLRTSFHIHCLYFIYARKIQVLTLVKITRQWKSALWKVARKQKKLMEVQLLGLVHLHAYPRTNYATIFASQYRAPLPLECGCFALCFVIIINPEFFNDNFQRNLNSLLEQHYNKCCNNMATLYCSEKSRCKGRF